jgi:hypothetical protein
MISRKKLRITKWFPPYTGEKDKRGRKIATMTQTGRGCYLIKKDGKIVYVGKSDKSLKKTIYRHFQQWTDLRSAYGRRAEPYDRVTYKYDPGHYLIKVIYSNSSKENDLLEQVLIKKLKPKDNSLKLELFTRQQEGEINDKMKDLEEAPF